MSEVATPAGREVDGPGAAAGPARPLGPGTLGRQLLLRVLALVALLAIVLSALTTLGTRQLLIGDVDDSLNSAVARQQRGGRDDDGDHGPPGGVNLPGQRIGTVILVENNNQYAAGILTESGPRNLTQQEAISVLLSVPADNHKRSVQLDGLGHYRVLAFSSNGGEVVVVGIPLDRMDRMITALIGLQALLTLLALAGSFVAVRAVVLTSLRPLNRVAATAHQVSELKLDSGEVDLGVRVAEADANPNNEVGQVGSALNHMLGNVEGALAARQASETKVRQFVADASHELRNPLAAIRGYAELTRRHRAELPPDTAFAMSRVESEAERMSHLVEDLLLLARLDAASQARDGDGPGGLTLEPVDLTDLVINAVSDARAAGPDHVWQLDVGDEPVQGLADRYRLHQVVANLLANARTHTPPGTTVRTGIRAADGMAVITVLDDGPGIDPALQPHIFERFTRADTSRARADAQTAQAGGSTGLGLAIVAAVMDAHHGSASVESRPGHTEFTLRVPLA